MKITPTPFNCSQLSISGICQTSNIKPLHENSDMMQSGRSNNSIERNNGNCKKSSKMQDSSDNMIPQKQRKTDSSEVSNSVLSQRNEGINSSSQNKMFSHPNDPSETDMKPNKNPSLNHSDRKNGQTSNIQTSKTKLEGGTIVKKHFLKNILIRNISYLINIYQNSMNSEYNNLKL